MNFGTGEAAFCLSDAQMPDSHDLLTALWGGGELDGEGNPLPGRVSTSTVSLDARWFDGGPREELRDEVQEFKYVHKRTDASIKWRAVRRGAAYESNDEGQTVLFAAVGREWNGDFF